MATLDFPSNPTVGQEFTFGGKTWMWNGIAWAIKRTSPTPKSAYDIAIDQGFIGSQADWIASLKGVKGDTGDRGTDGTNAFPEAPADGKQYARQSGAWVEVAQVKSVIPVKNLNSNYTLSSDDGQSYLRFTSTDQQICTVPSNSSLAFPIGTQIKLRQANTGEIVVASASGVTINVATDFIAQSRTKGSSIALIKVGTDEWDLMGDLKLS